MSNQNQVSMLPMGYNNQYNPQMMGMNNNMNMTPYNFNIGLGNQYNQMMPGYNFSPMYNPYNPMAPPLNNYNRFNTQMPGNMGGMQTMQGMPQINQINQVNGFNNMNNLQPMNHQNHMSSYTPNHLMTPNSVMGRDNYNNQPVKLTGVNNTGNMSGINTNRATSMTVIDEERKIGRSKREQDKERVQRASSTKRDRNDSSYMSQNSGYLDHNTSKNGPSTNPESFSRVRAGSANRIKTNPDGSYKPYSLKEFKDLPNPKIPLGKLGPNLGTREWEERVEKMKKMEEYANSVNKQHQSALKLKKELPHERIERERREKNEQSNRYKAGQYSKLVKPRQRFSNQYYEETKDDDLKEMLNFHRGNTSESNRNMRYKDEASTISYENTKPSKEEEEAKELQRLQNYREAYNKKITEIKDSFLKQV